MKLITGERESRYLPQCKIKEEVDNKHFITDEVANFLSHLQDSIKQDRLRKITVLIANGADFVALVCCAYIFLILTDEKNDKIRN